MKEQHITKINEMVPDDEYPINWCEESGALIRKTDEGYELIDVSYGIHGEIGFYREDEVEELVVEAMSYT